MSVQQLPQGVVKLISSTQVINSISSVVKELLENALDAGATVIDVKLDRYGLDKIEVRDNGPGIHSADIDCVCLPHFTSKIRDFHDLEHVQSYGFRGEALHSLCATSELSITTKTKYDEVASTYFFDNNGTVRCMKPSHQMNGTVVTVVNLFRNVPVRKQLYESSRKGAEELKKIERVVKHLSIIHPKLRVTLAHNKCLIWHKTSVHSLRQSLLQVYSSAILKNLKDVSRTSENITVEMLIANRECNLPVLLQPVNEAILLYVNQRPVKDKKIENVILEEMNHLFASALPANKCPLTLISLKLSPKMLDVNLEPNKTKVFINEHGEVLKQIRETIMDHFYEKVSENDFKSSLAEADELQNPWKKRKFEDETNCSQTTRKDDCNVRQMRNIIIEKVNADAENALKELADIDLCVFDEPLSIEGEERRLNESADSSFVSKDDSFVVSNSNSLAMSKDETAFSSTPNERKRDECDSSALSLPSCVDADLRNEVIQVQRLPFSITSSPEKNIHEGSANVSSIASPHRSVNLDQHCQSNKNKEITSIILDKDDSITKYSSQSNELNEVTLSQWSRGHVTVDNAPLSGGVRLIGNLEKYENSGAKTKKISKETVKRRIVDDDCETYGMDRSVSSQMGRKDMAGFTNFARQIRSEIIKETPGLSFTKVAGELASRWRNLHDDKKKSYIDGSSSSSSSSSSSVGKCKQKSALDFEPKETFKKKTLALAVSTSEIFEKLKIPGSLCRRVSDCKTRLIGPLETKAEWLYKIGDVINVVNIAHLQENVLLHRFICNSSVPLEPLTEPIEVSSRVLDENLWNCLLSLERSDDRDNDSTTIVSDCRLIDNGFKLVVHEEPEHDSKKFSVVEMAKEYGMKAIENLAEILKLAQQCKQLEKCRTETVKKMLSGKVLKMCEQKTLPKQATEIKMLLQYWLQCMAQKKICFHREPVHVNLHTCSI